MEKTVFIDSDFMPPTAERFCLIPEAVMDSGFDSVCIKIIDNYPWEFDCRLKSDTAYDEKVVDFFARKCRDIGLKLIFVFPGEDDYCRLLRQNGYKRMSVKKNELLKIDSNAVGFNSLMESIIEDFSSLCPDLYSVVLESGIEHNDYINKISGILDRNGFKPFIVESIPEFITVNKFLEGSDSEPDRIFMELQKSQNDFSTAAFGLNVFLTMSSLGRSMPAADRHSLNIKYCTFIKYREKVGALLQKFKRAATGKIDEDWLKIYIKSITLTVNDNYDGLKHRLKRFGLLN